MLTKALIKFTMCNQNIKLSDFGKKKNLLIIRDGRYSCLFFNAL